MSNMPFDHDEDREAFISVDDHIMLAGDDMDYKLDVLITPFINFADQLDGPMFDQYATEMIYAYTDEYDITRDTLSVARRSFLFGKLVGFCVLELEDTKLYLGDLPTTNEAESSVFGMVVRASLIELRDSYYYKQLIESYRLVLDPSESDPDVVDLFAGFALFTTHNAVYRELDRRNIRNDADAMKLASDETWEKGFGELFGEA